MAASSARRAGGAPAMASTTGAARTWSSAATRSVAEGGEECRCALRGCWETIASLRWLRAEATRRKLPGATQMTAGRLVAQVEKGTKAADEVLDRFADHLAVGLANLTMMFNPERLILHGDVVAGGEPLRTLIEAHTKARVLPYLRSTVPVALSTLDQDAGLLGAAGLVLSETFHLATQPAPRRRHGEAGPSGFSRGGRIAPWSPGRLPRLWGSRARPSTSDSSAGSSCGSAAYPSMNCAPAGRDRCWPF